MIVRRFVPILTLTYVASCGPTAGDPTPDSTGSTAETPTTAGASSETSTSAGAPATGAESTGSTSTGELSTSTDVSTGDSSTTYPTGFIITPDGGSSCGAAFDPDRRFRCQTCDIFDQNCDPGEKCVAWAEGGTKWNGNKCVPVTGAGVTGDPCTAEGMGLSGVDDCALGFMCWDVDTENHGTCVPLCTGSAEMPQCPDEFACRTINEGVLEVCLPSCEPLVADCPEGEACIPHKNTFLCITDGSGDGGALNGPCEYENGCDPGLLCTYSVTASSACDQQAGGCCQPYCQLPDGPCPNPDQVCKPVFEPNPPDHEDVGYCGIP